MDSLESRIRGLIARVSGISPTVPGDADLYLDLGVASVHALELLTQLEQVFSIRIPDDDFVEATSIDRLVILVGRLAAGNGEHGGA
jgi:acyl carrier protein